MLDGILGFGPATEAVIEVILIFLDVCNLLILRYFTTILENGHFN